MIYSEKIRKQLATKLAIAFPSMKDHPKKVKLLFERFEANNFLESTVIDSIDWVVDHYKSYGEPQIGHFINYEEDKFKIGKNEPEWLKD